MSINNESEYEAAKREVLRLWNAAPGTPDGERLEELVNTIRAYEQVHYPVRKPTPEEMAAFQAEQQVPAVGTNDERKA